MADVADLEKMGRELKCPICWSLLKSAASLVCNHVFCNSCILESMKSVSDCPVCKVPFRRREIRAAPHMDSLVSIYKSMEVAAGTNIFSTQLLPPIINSEASMQHNDQKHISEAETMAKTKRKSKKQVCSKKNKKELEVSARRDDHHLSMKPSFPAKKRIHVTPFPISETPIKSPKTSQFGAPANEFKHNRESEEDKKIAMMNQEDPLLSPFFWLREEDDNENAENTNSQQTTGTPSSQNAPCFSDIKDSEDEMPSEVAPLDVPNAAEVFESEMFEWTQRPCSPELCSTPITIQNAETHRLKVQKEECLQGIVVAVSHEKAEVEHANAKRKLLKKSKKQKNKIPAKSKKVLVRTKRDISEIAEDLSSKNEGAKKKRYISLERERVNEVENPVTCDEKESCKIPPNQNLDAAIAEESEKYPSILLKAKDKGVGELNASVVNRSKGMKMTNSNPKRKRMRMSLDNSLVKVSEILASSVNKLEGENQDSQTSYVGRKLKEPECQKAKSQAAEQPESKDVIQMYATSVDITTPQGNQTAVNCVQKLQMTFPIHNLRKNKSQNLHSLTLRKCKTINSQFQCAFCHSSTDTEVSGEMMHYFSGKPVNADFNGGLNVIHAHKHCTEWAPDIYFQDDLVVNLTTEIARSRRIKCCCCGIKGAALGCYEKSCRKSFHYTCAMRVTECQWDTENFVMLCPLHSSLKLPSETSETQRGSRKRCIVKRTSQASSTPKPCVDLSQTWTWHSGSPCKWFLCGSALSAAEKEELGKFAKLTGVPISNSWHPEVTHVIASTNENGACKRTLKVLKAILDGKWILRFDWVRACVEAMKPVDEEKFEITTDVHGINKGPQLGRLRTMNKQPKLFNGLTFYLSGEYTPSYKGYLQDLVITAGGTILQRKPISRNQETMLGNTSRTLIVFSLESAENQSSKEDLAFNNRQIKAQALADASGGTAVPSTWVIDSIAGCKLQPLA